MSIGRERSFWRSEKGERYRDARRAASKLHLILDLEPRTKRTKGQLDANNLHQLMLSKTLPWRSLNDSYKTCWPHPRAEVALDLHFNSTKTTPPRIDAVCKWLLDILGKQKIDNPIVYNDDRQVKLLFARLNSTPDEEDARPVICVQAQTLTETLAGIRRARSLHPPWRPQNEHRDIVTEEEELLDLNDELAENFGGNSSGYFDNWQLRMQYLARFKHQQLLLRSADQHATSILNFYAEERLDKRGSYAHTLAALKALRLQRYAFDLGQLPIRPGESDAFIDNMKNSMTEYTKANPQLFPLFSTVGLTLFCVEHPRGKDLDNLLRTVVPIALDCLEPPDADLGYWFSDDTIRKWSKIVANPSTRFTRPGVEFVEAIALRVPPDPKLAPGTVFMTLSRGQRRESWWGGALSHIDAMNRNDYDESPGIFDG